MSLTERLNNGDLVTPTQGFIPTNNWLCHPGSDCFTVFLHSPYLTIKAAWKWLLVAFEKLPEFPSVTLAQSALQLKQNVPNF